MPGHELHKVPFIRLLIPFLLGIILNLVFKFPVGILLGIDLAVLVVFAGSYFFLQEHFTLQWISGIVLNLVLFMAGTTVLGIHRQQIENVSVRTSPAGFVAEVLEPVRIKTNSVTTVLEIQSDPVREHVISVLEKDSFSVKLKTGDVIMVKAKRLPVAAPTNPGEFNYKQYCFNKGILRQAYIPSRNWKKTEYASRHSVKSRIMKLREALLNRFRMFGLTGNEFGVLAGIVFGYTADITKDTISEFSKAGVIHILSVSGLHVGIVYMLFNVLLFFLTSSKHGRWLRFVLIMAGTWIYVILSGFSPPAVRAAVMFSFIEGGKTAGRNINPLNSLAVSAFLILLLNPFSVADIGFQLSYLAVAGIMIWYKPLYGLWQPVNRFADKIWALTCVSITAQAATVFLSIYYFHNFPVYFLLANLVAVPLSSLILYSSLAFIPLSYLKVGSVISAGLKAVIDMLLVFIRWIEQLPFSSFHMLKLSGFGVVCMYLAMALITMFFYNKNKKYLMSAVFVLLLVALQISADRIYHCDHPEIAVYNIKGKSAVGLINTEKAVVFSDKKITQGEKDFFINNYLAKKNCRNSDNLCFDTTVFEDAYCSIPLLSDSRMLGLMGKRILVFNDSLISAFESERKIKCDFLIITGRYHGDMKNLLRIIDFEKIIFDSSVEARKRNHWIQECLILRLDYHDVAKNAFVYPLSYPKL